MRYLFCFILIAAVFATMVGQVPFIDKSDQYTSNHIYGTGVAGGGISFVDFNGDGMDDLSLASSKGQLIYFFISTGFGMQRVNLIPDLKEEVKHLLWVDIDNDGDKDLFLTLVDNYNRLFINEGNLKLVDKTLQLGLSSDVYSSFGACWGDFNRDGWLDLYYGLRRLEKDGKPNISKLWMNTGRGFKDVTLESGTEDGGKTPFCSSFLDYDNDKWPDIYTAHDRKRGNTMLKNNRNGKFTDVSISTGTELKMDGMSVSTGDCNNDGYFDLYISNTEVGNALFMNQNGTKFINQASERGVAFNSIAWGTNFLDGDNDGDLDLYVSGMLVGASQINSQYYINQYPLQTFIPASKIPSDTVSSFNNAYGDLNNDGYPDIGVINISDFPSFVFENRGGSNNYIKVKLKGVRSNADGTGSVITVFSGGRKQLRYTQCGIGFMGQNSDIEIIGLGVSTKVDSMHILWPTGHIDKINNLSVNQKYIITEGQSTNNIIKIDPDVTLLMINDVSDIYSIQTPFFLYPNPATDHVILESRTASSCLQSVRIFEINGKMVLDESHIFNQNYLRLDVSSVPSGNYVVKLVTCDEKVSVLPLLISK